MIFSRKGGALVLVHTATHTPNLSQQEYNNFMLGNIETRQAGRLMHALQVANLFKGRVQLYLPLQPDIETGQVWLKKQAIPFAKEHAVAFGLSPAFVEVMLEQAEVDFWNGGTYPNPNTTAEALRATIYAKKQGFTWIQPVSTGGVHAERCQLEAFWVAQQAGLKVPGAAPARIAGLESESSVVIDPPHLQGAAVNQVPSEHQFHRLVQRAFKAFGSSVSRWQAFLDDLGALLKKHGA
jgi:hypothetical protein